MVRPLDLKTIRHYTMTWNCKCAQRTDVSKKQAVIECNHMPAKTLEYTELVAADHVSAAQLLFEPKLGRISKGNIFDDLADARERGWEDDE